MELPDGRAVIVGSSNRYVIRKRHDAKPGRFVYKIGWPRIWCVVA
jgi:hypothetical protein